MLEFYATTVLLIKLIFYIKNKTQCFALRYSISIWVTQLTFTCSKWTIETLEKGVKYVQS